MSQKTGEGLLNEEEVKNYLNETFNLKLNRDALINPKKDTVVDLYKKFLDCRKPGWRRSKNPKATLLAIMVGRLRALLQGYTPNDKRDFHFGDLTMPDRRRTNYFLNALIYIKAQVDDIFQDWQQWATDYKADKEIAQELRRELEEAKRELENAAIRKSQAKSVDELQKELKNLEALVGELEIESEKSERSKLKLKESLQSLAVEREDLEKTNNTLKERFEQKESLLHSLNDAVGLKNTISKLEQQIQISMEKLEHIRKSNDNLNSTIAKMVEFQGRDNLDEDFWPKEIQQTRDFISRTVERKTALENERKRLIEKFNNNLAEENSLKMRIENLESLACKTQMQAKISEEQAEADLREAKSRRQKDSQQMAGEINALNESLVNIEKALVKLKEDRNKSNEQYEDYIKRLEQKRETFLENHQRSIKSNHEAAEELQKLDERINDLMGNSKYSAVAIRENILSDQNLPTDRSLPIDRSLPADRSSRADRTYTIN